MKYHSSILTVLFSLMLFAPGCFSQELESTRNETNQKSYDFHMAKHKKLKKTGFILLGSGVAATVVGALIASNSEGIFDDSDNLGSGAILTTAGILTTISSIPVFIVSGSNKRKAETFLKVELNSPIGIPFPNSQYISIGVNIEL